MNSYQTLLEVGKNTLQTVLHLIDKAEAHTKEHSLDDKALLLASIAPDMFNFTKQIQVATDDIRRNLRVLAGKEHIKMEDTETTFSSLRERVTATIKIIEELDVHDFEGADERHVSFSWMNGAYVEGKDFVTEFAFSNFLFHVVVAYSILRKEGVSIGKMDFITKFSMKKEL